MRTTAAKSVCVFCGVILLLSCLLPMPAAGADVSYAWVKQDTGSNRQLSGVSCADASHLWASADSGKSLFYNGASWSEEETGGVGTFAGISAADQNNVWMVGNNGRVVFFDGTSWSNQASGTGSYLVGVSALDAGNVWAVGWSGTIVYYDGTNWVTQETGYIYDLRGVDALDASHVWAVGTGGHIRFYDGAAWNDQPSGIADILWDVDALDASHVWAVGWDGTIVFYDGTSWSRQASGVTDELCGVYALDGQHVWAVGSSGTILFFDGTSWSEQESGTVLGLSGVSGLDSEHVWAVGDNGTVLLGQTISIESCSPATARIGETARVEIVGSNTHFEDGKSAADFGQGVSVISTTVTDETHATATITISKDADAGPREVNIVTEDERPVPLSGGLTVEHSSFYFAEGTCRPGFDPYLCIQNPGAGDAEVKVTYMLGDGTTREETLTVAASSRSTVVVKQTLGEGDDPAHDFSCLVETTNDTGIIVERPMYFNYKGEWTGGHDVVGY
ncbi:MAG: hypothetical protein L6433_02200 [Actinomycetia bacterium]|nr:hypothetical protein [Actinomycetes bacterium]